MWNAPRPQTLRWVKRGLIVVVLMTFLRLWVGPADLDRRAQAQIPDSGMQRKLMLEELRRTNQLLMEIKQILASGTFNVRVEGADNKGADN
ncbi:MAG: hypothetical protein ACE5HE_02670 [Phycisphaerae bacterium]